MRPYYSLLCGIYHHFLFYLYFPQQLRLNINDNSGAVKVALTRSCLFGKPRRVEERKDDDYQDHVFLVFRITTHSYCWVTHTALWYVILSGGEEEEHIGRSFGDVFVVLLLSLSCSYSFVIRIVAGRRFSFVKLVEFLVAFVKCSTKWV